MYRNVRIRILRRSLFRELVAEHAAPELAESIEQCPVFQDGQEFLLEGWPAKPDGFCDWAWSDIQKAVVAASFGGRKEGLATQDAWIACCTDGLRPVVFLIQPLPADASKDRR